MNQYIKGIVTTNTHFGYYQEDRGNYTRAMDFYKKNLEIEQKQKNKQGISDAFINMGNIYKMQGNFREALNCFNKSLIFYTEIQNKKGMSNCYNNIGIIYKSQGSYLQALDNYLKSLKIREEMGDKQGMSSSYNNLGTIYYNQRNYTQALEYYRKSMHIYKEQKNKQGIALCYNNIGNVYSDMHQNSQALDFFKKSLEIRKEINDKSGLSTCYNNIGIIYENEKKYDPAIEFYNKSIKIREEIGDKQGIALILVNIGSVYNKTKNYRHALVLAEKSLLIAKETGALNIEKYAYQCLSSTYDSLGNINEALKYFKLFIMVKDSLFSQKQWEIAKMEAMYHDEKRQKEIEILNKDKELQKLEIKRQTLQKYTFLGGFSLMLILVAVILVSYRKIKAQKIVIEEKNSTLNRQNEEIAEQRNTVIMQKEQIEEIHSELKDSIYYAESIQQAVLPSVEIINTYIKDYFILFKPRDIVSGDFYWLTMRNNWLLVAVADCTGHGVPGALMSMLGISFLNEINAHQNINQASQVLNELRDYIVTSLQQRGVSGEHKDGMDIAFCAINTGTLEMHFAGANNPLYIVETGHVPSLQEIRPDKMPVAIHVNMQPFTNHVIQLQKGDTIYLTSDGYKDQFGGPKGKKFYEKRLKEMILANSYLSMLQQKEILDKTIEDWREPRCGNATHVENCRCIKYEQTDDITIFALKV
ncbi:MAG: tetratricopeptide repeat protein [Bacteroidia bacterium]|nr:tetratricopeptide repeat protein [Bacteroidia bacterium]